jgi:hypothetical protein
MIARVAAFEGIDVEAAAATMDEALPVIRGLVEGLPGYRGMLELGTADGKVLSITFFDSETDAAASEPTFDQEMPKALGHVFEQWAGRRVSVDLYTVGADERR